MSAGAVFQEALRALNRLQLGDEARRDLVAVLEAGRPGPLAMFYAMGLDAGLENEQLLPRAAALYLGFCTGNLTDDLVDGDCDYLEPPYRIGPGLQYLLHNAFYAALLDAGLPARVVAHTARELAVAASAHQAEVRTVAWDAERYRRIGGGIAGRQNAAYLGALWHGTPLERLAEPLGLALGEVAHIAEDLRSDDPRFFTMPPEDRRAVAAWARAALAEARRHGLPSVEAMARTLEPRLARDVG